MIGKREKKNGKTIVTIKFNEDYLEKNQFILFKVMGDNKHVG